MLCMQNKRTNESYLVLSKPETRTTYSTLTRFFLGIGLSILSASIFGNVFTVTFVVDDMFQANRLSKIFFEWFEWTANGQLNTYLINNIWWIIWKVNCERWTKYWMIDLIFFSLNSQLSFFYQTIIHSVYYRRENRRNRFYLFWWMSNEWLWQFSFDVKLY